MNGVCRYAPHEENPVDCMSKIKVNAARMLQMFRIHEYRQVGEADELEHQRKYRETTGMKNHDLPYGKIRDKYLRQPTCPTISLEPEREKGKSMRKTIKPKPGGPGHDDEWLVIDDDSSSVPQAVAVSPELAPRAPRQGSSAFITSNHDLGCVCMDYPLDAVETDSVPDAEQRRVRLHARYSRNHSGVATKPRWRP